MNASHLQAFFDVRIQGLECLFHCPSCGKPLGIRFEPEIPPLPYLTGPGPCPDCGMVLHLKVVPGFQEAPKPANLSVDLAKLERAFLASPDATPAPAADQLALANTWQLILSRLELPSTRMLLSQQAALVAIDADTAVVAVKEDWLSMVRTRAELLRDAIQQARGDRPALELRPVKVVPALPVVPAIRPPAPRWTAQAPAATPRRKTTRRAVPRRAPAAPPPPQLQPCPQGTERFWISTWHELGVEQLADLSPARIAKTYRRIFRQEPRRIRQSRCYSARELAAVLQQLDQPIPAVLQGQEVGL